MYNVRQIVAWLGQIRFLTESVSQDNVAAIQRLKNTRPSMPPIALLNQIVELLPSVTREKMDELHNLVEDALDSDELVDLGTPKITSSF